MRAFFLLCFMAIVDAWAPPTSHRISQPHQRFRQSEIHLKFLENSEDKTSLELSIDEDEAIRSVAKGLSKDEAYGVGWFDNPDAWAQAKSDFPVLAEYDDLELRDAYLKQKPKFYQIFTETPLGPFLFVNLAVKFSGFTWCDTPFGQIEACPPL